MKGMSAVFCSSVESDCTIIQNDKEYFKPFISNGFVSLCGGTERVPVKILRDTGSMHSFVLGSILPFSHDTLFAKTVWVIGMDMNVLPVPMHSVCLDSELVQGEVCVGVLPVLPVSGISVILGNDLDGCKVWSGDGKPSNFFTDTHLQGDVQKSQWKDSDVTVVCSSTSTESG